MHKLVATLAFALALSTMQPAWAGKDKAADLPAVTMTTIAQFDEVFGKAKTIETNLNDSSKKLVDGRGALNKALGIAADAPLATALADLQAKAGDALSVTLEGGKPKLKLSDAAPENVKAAVAALDTLVNECSAVVDNMTAIPDQVTALTTAAAAFPGQITSIQVSDKMLLLKLPKMLTNNAKALGAFPERAKLVGAEAGGIVKDVSALAK